MPPPRLPYRPVTGSAASILSSHPSHTSTAISSRFFSTSLPRSRRLRIPVGRATRQRQSMFQWLLGPGAPLRQPLKGSTNYLGAYDASGNLKRSRGFKPQEQSKDQEDGQRDASKDTTRTGVDEIPPETEEDLQPFPLNPFFRSQSVLSEPLRDEIYKRVAQQGQTLRQVSQELSVTMERVAAVVRLKTIEHDWVKQDKPLARPYSNGILAMLPQTSYTPTAQRNPRHESINDLPVHSSTLPQIFHPTSESRRFTRADAGRVFHRALLPADARIPHPDMIEQRREENSGLGEAERARRRSQRWQDEEAARVERDEERRLRRDARVRVHPGKRWDFRVEAVVSDDVSASGPGKGRKGGVGARYGVPWQDRKKGQIKIPTSVPA